MAGQWELGQDSLTGRMWVYNKTSGSQTEDRSTQKIQHSAFRQSDLSALPSRFNDLPRT